MLHKDTGLLRIQTYSDNNFYMEVTMNNCWIQWILFLVMFAFNSSSLDRILFEDCRDRYCIQQIMAVHNREFLHSLKNVAMPPFCQQTASRIKALALWKRRRGQKGGCRRQHRIQVLAFSTPKYLVNKRNSTVNIHDLITIVHSLTLKHSQSLQ